MKEKTVRFLHSLRDHNMVFVLLTAVIVFFSVLSPRFFSLMNLKNIVIQNTYMFVATLGVMIIMSSGGLDFSVNYQIALISVMTGILFEAGFRVPVTLLLILVMGLVCGLCNGILVSYLHVVPILATILSGFLFNGLANMLSKSSNYTNLPAGFRALAQLNIAGMSLDVWVALACFLIVLFIFEFTVIGKYIRALGSSGASLMLQAGINTNKIKIVSYMLGSLFIAVSAAMMVARQGMANAAVGDVDYGILALCAVYIGGITPGVFRSHETHQRASVIHSMAGVFVIVTIRNGIQLAEMNQYVENVMIGIVLLITVMFRSSDPFGMRLLNFELGKP